MTLYPRISLALLALGGALLPSIARAEPSINDMQGCQAYIEHIDRKLDAMPEGTDPELVAGIKAGLLGYTRYIQERIVTPGLLDYTGGDKAKASAMQDQINDYKAALTQRLKERFPQPGLFMDYAVAINECTKQAVPSGADQDGLKSALDAMAALARQR